MSSRCDHSAVRCMTLQCPAHMRAITPTQSRCRLNISLHQSSCSSQSFSCAVNCKVDTPGGPSGSAVPQASQQASLNSSDFCSGLGAHCAMRMTGAEASPAGGLMTGGTSGKPFSCTAWRSISSMCCPSWGRCSIRTSEGTVDRFRLSNAVPKSCMSGGDHPSGCRGDCESSVGVP